MQAAVLSEVPPYQEAYVGTVAAALEAAGVPVTERFVDLVNPPDHFIRTTLAKAIIDVGWVSNAGWFAVVHLWPGATGHDKLSGPLTPHVDAGPATVVGLVTQLRDRVERRLVADHLL